MRPGQGLAHLLIGQPEIAERIMRALSLKGALPQYLDEEFQATMLAEDFTKQEYSYLRRETLWGAGLFAPAVAAETALAVVGPRNNSFRTTLIVVESVLIQNQNGVATSFRYGLIDTAHSGSAAATSDGSPRDDRSAKATRSFAAVGVGSNAAAITTFSNSQFVILPASGSILIPGPWIISNGEGPAAGSQVNFAVWGTVVNQTVQCAFQWHERTMLASEIA